MKRKLVGFLGATLAAAMMAGMVAGASEETWLRWASGRRIL